MTIRKILQIARDVGEWVTGRRRRQTALIVRAPGPGRFGRMGPREDEATEPEVFPPGDGDGLEDAIEDYTTPSHGEHRSIRFREVTDGGEIDRKQDEWRRQGNGMVFTGVDTKVVAASGAAADPEQLACRCSRCGKFDVFAHACMRCGRIFCAACSVRTVTPEGPLTLCTAGCWQREVREFDTWTAFDQAETRGDGMLPIPRRPFSANTAPTESRRKRL